MSSATHTQGPAAAAGGTAALRRQSRPGNFGPFRLQQLVLLETAAALPLVAYAAERVLLWPAVAVSVAVVGLALARRRGRPALDWLATAGALRRRNRRAEPAPRGTDPALVPAVECDPALRTLAFTAGDRRTVGMIGDGTFLSVVLQVQGPATALRGARTERPLPLDVLHQALDVDGIRLESIQVVQHTQPAPAPHLPAQSVAARSYAPLQERSGAPAVRLTWVALKLDPQLCREAVEARGGGVEGAQRCLVRAADQLASRLAGLGFRASVLDEDELVTAVATSACASPVATAQWARAGQPSRRTVESARSWRCDDRWHTTYWIARWPQLGSGGAALPQLVALLTATPALASTFSLTLGRGAGRAPAITGHVRIAGRSDDELVAARRELERAARGVKAGLVRLDREQVPGLLATLPLGGAR
ncbi:type VII secretion protein EccE [Streptomyces sp. URMC 123]|uniref:type VII secretion protein EccE n=1 Tax=Streptomyces sp. URMC 123 TaxID=3423403 RepID=UPI003F1CB7FD